MGYFDKLAENSFKVFDEKTLVYYPNGAIGKGRVIPNESIKDKIFRFHKNIYKITFFVVFPYMWLAIISTHLSLKALSPIAIFAIIFYAWQQYLIRGLTVHNSKLGFNEAMQKGSKSLPNWYYWSLASLSIGLIAFGILFPLSCSKPYSHFILPVIGISSFGLLGLSVSIKMYKLKNPS